MVLACAVPTGRAPGLAKAHSRSRLLVRDLVFYGRPRLTSPDAQLSRRPPPPLIKFDARHAEGSLLSCLPAFLSRAMRRFRWSEAVSAILSEGSPLLAEIGLSECTT